MTAIKDPTPIDRLVQRGAWGVYAAQFASQLVSLVSLAALARLVSPADFGLLGILLPLVMLPRMIATLGFSTAVVQHEKDDEGILSALFWRTCLWSLVAGLVTMGLAPLAAWIFDASQLVPLGIVLAIATILNALGTVHLAILERRMRFAAASGLRVVAQAIAAGIAIAIALQGGGAWALVAQHVVEILLLAILAWWLSAWRPLAPRKSFLPQETSHFGNLYSFAIVTFFAAQNLDKLLLAAWLGSSETGRALLGIYSQAYNLMQRPVFVVTNPLGALALSTLSRLSNAPAERVAWIERFYHWTALALFPASAGLYFVAPEVMQLLAPEWIGAGNILAALAPIIVAQGFINLSCLVLAAQGRSGLLLFAALLQLLLVAQAIVIGGVIATRGGMEPAQQSLVLAAAWALSLTNLIAFLVPFLGMVFTISNVPLSHFARAIRLPLVATAIMALSLSMLPLDQLVARLAVGVGVYVAIVGAVFAIRRGS